VQAAMELNAEFMDEVYHVQNEGLSTNGA
jgi:hypothetical protein